MNFLWTGAIQRKCTTKSENEQKNLKSVEKSKQDSKESSPRSLDKMLLKLQVNSQNVQNTKFSKFSKSSKFLKCSKFKPCQIIILKYSYDTKWCNHINPCHSKNLLNMYGLVPWELIILKSLIQIDTILQTY